MKTILITGASRGIGYETARALASAGQRVVAVARTEEALDQLQNENPARIDTVCADIASENDVRSLVQQIGENGLRLDGIIHNAGKLINKPFTGLSDEEWREMLDVNLMGPVRLTRNLLERLNRDSHIVHISSMGGYQQSSKFPGLSGYSSTKGALTILTECLATEFAGKGIRVNCLCLGAVQTEMLAEAFPGLEAPVSAARMGEYVADFVLNGHQLFNGKILPVALADPG